MCDTAKEKMDRMALATSCGWQGRCRTVRERTSYLLRHSPIPFDVKFRVGSLDVKEAVIEAHRHVLAIGSEYFYSLFYGPFPKKATLIEVFDRDPTAFAVMVQYAYTDVVDTAQFDADFELAFETMRCAGEYGFPYLYNICRDWLLQQIDINFSSKKEVEKWALRYLQAALRPEYENLDILEALWYEIDVNTVSVIRTADDILQSIDRKTLAEVLKRDTLTVPGEKVLHDFAVRWVRLKSVQSPTANRMGHLNELIRYSAMAAAESAEGPAGAGDGALAKKESMTIYCYDTFRDRADRIWETPFPDKRRVGTRAAALISIVLQQRDSGKDLHKLIIRRRTQRDAISYASVKLREIIHSQLDWDPAKEKPDWIMTPPSSGCTFFTCHFRTRATMDEAAGQHLLHNGFQSVFLSFGDVAAEIELVPYGQGRDADWVMNGARQEAYGIKRLTFIFGDKSQGLYRCTAGSVVYYLGRLVKGRESLLRARQLLKAAAGHAATAPSPVCISAVSVKTKKYTGSDPALDLKPQIVFLQ